MKKSVCLMTMVLALYSSAASSGFDFGKLLEMMGQVSQKQKSDSAPATSGQAESTQPTEQAPGQTSSAAVQTSDTGTKPIQQTQPISLLGKTKIEDEIRIGKQIAGNLLGAAPLVKDDMLQQYVNRVGRWVALQSSRPDLPWKFGVIESDSINAFAAPGGYVFLTKGLYKRLNNEAELAGVLAHEIAHVCKKHHLDLLKKSSLIGMLTQSLSKKVKGDGVVQNLIGNGAEMLARGLDKEAEFEADRIGIVYAARSGYDPWGLPAVLQDMATLNPNDDRLSLLYKTHPSPSDRLTRLAEAVGDRFDNLPPGKEFADRFYRIR